SMCPRSALYRLHLLIIASRSFFLHRPGHLCALPSFPTRRSSDLLFVFIVVTSRICHLVDGIPHVGICLDIFQVVIVCNSDISVFKCMSKCKWHFGLSFYNFRSHFLDAGFHFLLLCYSPCTAFF